MKKVIIIGAGVGGLATANLLKKAGYDVHVYEKEAIPGGRAGQFKSKGFTFDTGPSWYLMPDVFEHYYNLLGTTTDEQLELVKLSPAYKVFFEQGDPVTIKGNLDEDAKTFESIEQGSGAALRKYVTKANTTYRLALKHFLYSNFTATKNLTHGEIVKRAGEMLKLALMPIDRYVSGFVTNQRLKQVLEYPMVFLGSSPYNAPALYSLMSALDFKEGVFYPKGTMYAVIQSLHSIGKELGVTYHFGADVSAIQTDDARATGIRLQNGTTVEADIVISNADLHHTETHLLPESARSYPASYWAKKSQAQARFFST